MKHTPTLSPAQNAYAIAKIRADLAKDRYNAVESAFISARHLVNEDGRTPSALWQYTNCEDDVWDALCEEFNASPEAAEAFRSAETAERALYDAENDLIRWGLTVPGLPAGDRETIRAACDPSRPGFSMGVRRKMINLALRWTGQV